MTSRERMLLALSHREADRVPIGDSPWETTVARWRREGLPEDQSPHSFFGYDWAGMGADLSFQFPRETIEETDIYRIASDEYGATTKVFVGQESVPQPLEFTIDSRAKWEEHKPRMAWNDSRVDWDNALAGYRGLRDRGLFVAYSAGFGYDRVMRFVGAARVLQAMADDPAWVKDMMDTVAEAVITGAEEMMGRGFGFDGAFIWNDMGYRNGPFFSPAMYRELEFPAQKRMCEFFHARRLPVILHTDGDVRQLIPMLIEAGFDCLQPLEVKAGMDVVQLKRDYGDRLAFMGGIDVRAMADPDPTVIEREIRSKIPVAKRGGGYLYYADHSVPDNVSFAQYQRVLELVMQYGAF
jgi:uroporphyrinogen decarboxylase